jgi:hypothetical protein
MEKLMKPLKNEQGYFLILATIMLLALLTIISIAASNTASTEVQAVDRLQNDLNPRGLAFVESGVQVIDDDNFTDDWETKSQAVTATMDTSGKTRFRVGYEGTPAGYSLGIGSARLHGFAVYGRTENQGITTIKIGYRRAF